MDCYKDFTRNVKEKNNMFIMHNLSAKHRYLAYLLAIYHEYKWKILFRELWEEHGYDYLNKVEYGTLYDMAYLYRNRVHNLEYYDKVETEYGAIKYKLKNKYDTAKKGVSKERKTIEFFNYFLTLNKIKYQLYDDINYIINSYL